MTKRTMKKAAADAPLLIADAPAVEKSPKPRAEIEIPSATDASILRDEVGTSVARVEPRAIKLRSDGPGQVDASRLPMVAMMEMMERMATNPAVDIEKFRAVKDGLLELQARQAKIEFDAAFARMQPKLPTINRAGRIVVRAKDAKGERTGPETQNTPYALFEDINDACRPVLARHGFGVRFETGLIEGRVRVTGVLCGHGHEVRADFDLPHDSTGSKNAVQAIGSSTSYGKRYALCALLNITTRGEDDDGKSGGGHPLVLGDPVSPEQAEKIVEMCGAVECSQQSLMKYLNGKAKPKGHPDVTRVEDIPAIRFDAVIDALNRFDAARREQAKNQGGSDGEGKRAKG